MNAVSRSLYPFDGQLLELPTVGSGIRMHYLDEGPRDGEPVVMVHGNPTWSFYYRELVQALRGERRCVVPDHVGCGLSDKPDDAAYPYTLEQRVADLGALVDHLGLERITLVLHDWGGMIGMAWAAQNPERVRRLVLLNTAAFHKPADKRLPASLWLVRNTALGALLVRGLNAFARGATRMAVTRRKLTREVRDAYCAPYASWGDRIATLRFVQDIPMAPGDPGYDLVTATQEGLAQFQDTPALMCWGEKDFVFDEPFLQEWLRRLPHVQLHRFPDCGHYVLEDASEEILGLVRGFLDG